MSTKAEELKIKDFFKYIWNKKVSTSVIAGCIFLGSAIGLGILSYSSASYSATFTLSWPGIESEKYPDDSPYNYLDMISLANLQKVQYSDPSLNNIKVEEIFSKDSISINSTQISTTSNSGDIIKFKYDINIDKKYFDSKAQAKLFFTNLIDLNIYSFANNKIDNFKINNVQSSQTSSTQYDVIFNNIESQIAILKSYFEDEDSTINLNLIYDSEKNLTYSELITNFNLFIKYNDYQTLKNTYIKNAFVRDVNTYVEYYTAKKDDIINTMDLNNSYLETLKKQISDITSNSSSAIISDSILSEIAELAKANVDLQKELDYINKILEKPIAEVYNADFDKKVNDYQNEINRFTNELEIAYKTNMHNKTSLYYENNKIITQEGLNLLMVIILSLIISAVVTLLFTFSKLALMDSNKRQLILNKEIKESEQIKKNENSL